MVRGVAEMAAQTRPLPDPVLGVVAVILACFGAVAVYSATRGTTGDLSFASRQAAFVVVGILAMLTVQRLDGPRWRGLAFLLLITTTVVLGAVLTPLGSEVRGTQAWFRIFGLSIQPAEPAKLALVIVFAALFTSRRRIDDRARFAVVRFVAALSALAVVSILVIAGGETGSVLVYLALAVGIFFASGLPKRILGLLVVSAVVGVGFLLTTDALEPYQQQRIEAFVDLDADPLGAGYNQRQSLAAIGSGGMAGKGLFNGPQTQLRYLPEQQTDFIFAVISEELGFAGAMLVLLAEGLILYRILGLAKQTADPFGALVCVGVFSYLAFQVFQNVGMNLRLMPVAGIPLPFVSYGGSGLVTAFLAVGLVQAVAGERPKSYQVVHSLTDPGANRVSVRRAR